MIKKKIIGDFEAHAMCQEINAGFPGNSGCAIQGDVVSLDVTDNQSNNDALSLIIVAHDYSAGVDERKRDEIRKERDRRIKDIESRVFRYQRETRLKGRGKRPDTTDNQAKADEIDEYIETLCDFPDSCDLDDPAWPAMPE